MGIIEKISNWLKKDLNLKSANKTKKVEKLSYVSGKRGRLAGSWRGGTNINTDIRNYKTNVNDIAEEAIKNDNLAKGFIIRRQSNIIGHKGFILNVQAKLQDGNYDDEANKIIETAFAKWSKKENCTVTGKFTFWQVQLLQLTMYKKTGEILIRMIEKPGLNEFGFSLQLLHSNDLDHEFNTTLQDGHDVIMGVEVDTWGMVHAYWFKERNFWDTTYNKKLRRIPAHEILHTYDLIDVKQQRGISAFNQSIVAMNNLADWKGAFLKKAKSTMNNLGFIQKVDEEAKEYTPSNADDTLSVTRADGTTEELAIWEEEEGTYRFLPEGHTIQDVGGDFPSSAHADLDKSIKRDIATGLGDSYNSLANDLEGVNFSSMRSGKQDEQSNYMVEQQILIDGMFTQIYERWLKNALLNGAIDLDYANIEAYKEHFWQPRTYPWVDPWKDFQTVKGEIEAGLKSQTQACRERYGRDYRDVLRERAQEIKLKEDIEKEFGIKFPTGETNTAANNTAVETDEETEARENDEKNSGKSSSSKNSIYKIA